MNAEDLYIHQVLEKIPGAALRKQIEMELRSLIADRVERGQSVEEAIRQLGDPVALAESYMTAVPLVSAPFGRRAAAKSVDLVLVLGLPIAWLCLTVLSGKDGRLGRDGFVFPIAIILLAMCWTFVLCVYPWIAEYVSGQTLGKRLFGLRVVTEKGTRISLGQSFLRQMPIYLQIFVVDALFALFTEKRQRAFELISKTRVVDDREARQGQAIAAGTPA